VAVAAATGDGPVDELAAAAAAVCRAAEPLVGMPPHLAEVLDRLRATGAVTKIEESVAETSAPGGSPAEPPAARDESRDLATESRASTAAQDAERERQRQEQAEQEWAEHAERERRQFERRLKPVPEFGDGYQVAEWPGTGRYYLVHGEERIGHAAKKPFTSRWEAHTVLGSKVPGSGTYRTRREALIQVAMHHQNLTRKGSKRRNR
jgi:hypothetical protein